jgi:hypothetical protein
MSKKTYVVIDDGSHEYNIVVEQKSKGEVISLYYSENESWSSHIRGKLALKMLDNGNGVRFSKNLKSLDYSQLNQFRLLMNFEREIDRNELNKRKCQIFGHEGDSPLEI